MKGFKRKIRHISTEDEDLNNKKKKTSVEDDEILEQNEQGYSKVQDTVKLAQNISEDEKDNEKTKV